jgi:hypothetical protein
MKRTGPDVPLVFGQVNEELALVGMREWLGGSDLRGLRWFRRRRGSRRVLLRQSEKTSAYANNSSQDDGPYSTTAQKRPR